MQIVGFSNLQKFLERFLVLVLSFSIVLSYPPETQARQSTQAAFSPLPQAIELVERTIGKAEKSINVAAYSFTSHKIADALIGAHRVDVRVLLDMPTSCA